MRVSKFLSMVFFITLFSLLYVYQQSEIFRLAYVGQKHQTALDDLLDRNGVLKYTIEKNGSLVQIGTKLSGQADFVMPESYRLMKMGTGRDNLSLNGEPEKETLLSRIFGVKRQAEAKTIAPSFTPLVGGDRAINH